MHASPLMALVVNDPVHAGRKDPQMSDILPQGPADVWNLDFKCNLELGVGAALQLLRRFQPVQQFLLLAFETLELPFPRLSRFLFPSHLLLVILQGAQLR